MENGIGISKGSVIRLLAAAFGVVIFSLAIFLTFIWIKLGPLPKKIISNNSVLVLDRDGKLLRPFANPEGRWRLPISLDQIDPKLVDMLISYEDKRFYKHPGIDILALGRALRQFIANGRIISGGSTLTMQVGRLIEAENNRSFRTKLVQIIRAIQLEAGYSKQEILEFYFNLAPYGGNLEGVRAASFAYFGKEPRRLSAEQRALLVALPQSPEKRRPDRFAGNARTARDRVLDRAATAGVLPVEISRRAKSRPIPQGRIAFPFLAAHLTEQVAAELPAQEIHRLTIDSSLQKTSEQAVREHSAILSGRLSAALLVVENKTGNIVAHVGSPGYLDDDRFGAIDMTRASRSPGSTLKPLIYGLAFETGLVHPETLIEDRPTRFGDYVPDNFDKKFRGTVTLRTALQHSLNIPAVKLLESLDPSRLSGRLRRLDIKMDQPANLSMALGGLGLTLHDLAGLYAAIANGGQAKSLHYRQRQNHRQNSQQAARLLDPVSSWYVYDILTGVPRPRHANGASIAYKTGTSYGYKDAWAIGFNKEHTVAVWIGRPDNSSTSGLTGLTTAAPLLFDIFARIGSHGHERIRPPFGALVKTTAELPVTQKFFHNATSGQSDRTINHTPLEITFPPNRTELELIKSARNTGPILLKLTGGKAPFTWFVNDRPVALNVTSDHHVWKPEGVGFFEFTVVDSSGHSAQSKVRFR